MVNSTRPLYIDRGGEQVNRHPIQMNGVKLQSFILDARMDVLGAACDKYLNAPLEGKVRYIPVFPRVVLAFAAAAEARSLDGQHGQYGYMPEIDVALWVLTAAGTSVAGVFVFDHFAWFLPYTFVDSSYAMALGRETYGFAKAIGEFDLSVGPTDAPDPILLAKPARLAVRTLAVHKISPKSKATVQEILAIEPSSGKIAKSARELDRWEAPELFAAAFAQLLISRAHAVVPDASLRGLPDFLVQGRIPFVFLKQFRDVTDPLRACYQAVVEAPARMTRFHAGGLMQGAYRFITRGFDSHPFVRELGIDPQDGLVGVWTAFDFCMETGTEIHRTA